MRKRPVLRQLVDNGEFFVAPGLHDMIAAVVANEIGFDVVYASGYWLTASAYGLPDAGVATYTQMLERVSTLAQTCNSAIIADADTGYGGLLNVHHTVRGYEEAGVSGIQIEDQEFPKRCGHTQGTRVIPLEEAAKRISVACDARRDKINTLIIARTDARQTEGVEGAVRRAEAYADAGADVIFMEALESEKEMHLCCEALRQPMLANMADGGKTPILSASELEEIGYACAIFPATGGLATAKACDQSLRTLKAQGTSRTEGIELFDFETFNRLIGFQEVWDFERKWNS